MIGPGALLQDEHKQFGSNGMECKSSAQHGSNSFDHEIHMSRGGSRGDLPVSRNIVWLGLP